MCWCGTLFRHAHPAREGILTMVLLAFVISLCWTSEWQRKTSVKIVTDTHTGGWNQSGPCRRCATNKTIVSKRKYWWVICRCAIRIQISKSIPLFRQLNNAEPMWYVWIVMRCGVWRPAPQMRWSWADSSTKSSSESTIHVAATTLPMTNENTQHNIVRRRHQCLHRHRHIKRIRITQQKMVSYRTCESRDGNKNIAEEILQYRLE